MRILVADDERPARFVLRSLLEELGFPPESVEEAVDGRGLVEAATARRADCAFVDVRMPGMDGLAAVEAAAPACPSTRWVIVSSYAEFEYARQAIHLGVTEYLLKPVRLEELSACLDRMGIAPSVPEDDAALGPVIEYLRRNYNADVSVSSAAEIAGLSPNYLSTLFHARTGCTISEYLARLRAEAAAKLLRDGVSVAEAGQAVGYSDARHFARKFREIMGCLPSDLLGR
jgi:two-component system response regulator YesN